MTPEPAPAWSAGLSRWLPHDSEFRRAFYRRSSAEDAPDAEAPQLRDGMLRRTPRMARVEAALFVADAPCSPRRLANFATLADPAEAVQIIEQLNAGYDAVGSSFRIERVASGYQMLTRPAYALWLGKIHQRQSELKLSPPALETLTIVAYRQPITRADIEALRGVQSAEMLKHLMERGLVRISGEDDSLGRPYLYGTTRRFLEIFGLRNLNELPMADRLRAPAVSASNNSDASDEADAESDDATDDDDTDAAEDAADDSQAAA